MGGGAYFKCRGANLIFWRIFLENGIKMKNSGSGVGGVPRASWIYLCPIGRFMFDWYVRRYEI